MGLHKQRMASVMSLPAGPRAMAVLATPASLPGLVAWGEGSDLGVDGSAISSWLNKTGSGLDPAQVTAGNKPTVKANAINGQKAALFTLASAQFLTFPAGALGWFNAVSGATLIAVVQPTSAPAATGRILNAEVNASTGDRALLAVATGAYFARARRLDADAATQISGGTPTIGVPVIAASRVNFSGNSINLDINGASGAPSTFVSGAGLSQASNSQAVTIGATDVGGAPFDGYVAAYAMWNVAYSRSQLSGVLNRWSQLYGIPLAG